MLDQPDEAHQKGSMAEDGAAIANALSDCIRDAADYTRELADKLQGQNADQLVATAATWARRQPLLVVGGAVVLGFVLARLVKSGMTGEPHDSGVARAAETCET